MNPPAPIKEFFKRSPALTRLLRNSGILFSGNLVSAALNLVSLGVLTRTLGVEGVGIFALVTAYVALIDRLVSFQTWQAVIHFGAHALEKGARQTLTSLFFFGWILDVAGGVAGALLIFAGAALIPQLFGLEHVDLATLGWASVTLIFNWVGTPTAILRLFQKFALQAIYQKVMAFSRLVVFLILWMMHVSNPALYIIAWALCGLGAKLMFFFMGYHTARHRGYADLKAVDLKDLHVSCPGLWRFVLTTNLDGIIRVLREADIFVINALLGTTATGLYKIAREIAQAFSQLTGPFYQAIYPELAQMAARSDFSGFNTLIRQASFSLGGVLLIGWFAFALIGRALLEIAFGTDFAASFTITLWTMAAMVVWGFGQPLSPALLALGRAQTNLILHTLTSLCYIALLYALCHLYALNGAGAALLIFFSLWTIASAFALKRAVNKALK